MGKFKVGDRVRAVHSSSLGLFLTGHEYEVLDVRHEKITAINERGQRDSWGADHFELLPVAKGPGDQPALKIEAGKYYRTREGRKVGPMESEGFYWGASEVKDSYYNDGRQWRSYESPLDLIAEWVDEPVKADEPAEACEIIRLTVTADTTDLDARLDGIIQKLERIDALSSKLGIAA